MMTSSRPRDTGESFSNRRGHTNQLSISDPSHHVTEAIGTLYGDSDDDSAHETRHDNRPLSFIASPYGGEQLQKLHIPLPLAQSLMPIQDEDQTRPDGLGKPTLVISDTISITTAAATNEAGYGSGTNFGTSTTSSKKLQIPPVRQQSENIKDQSNEPYHASLQPSSPLSPTLSLRDVQADAQGGSQFPLTNIDNPNDIAQELSNLQALRRMSMDVGNSADPDLIPFQGLSLMEMPSIAPSGEDDEGDISRLLWVPAKVHPELAPDQFKNFLEKRVQSIKRRSGDSLLAPDSQQQRDEPSGLSRKKSMLSRQIDSRTAESEPVPGDNQSDNSSDHRPRRGASRAGTLPSTAEVNIQDLVSDTTGVVQRLALDNQKSSDEPEKSNLDEDKPILPVPSMGLRRSTRTTYRKGGSLRHGTPYSKRATAARQVQEDADKDGEASSVSPSSDFELPFGHVLQRSQSAPLVPDNFSRPVRPANRRFQMATEDSGDAGADLAEVVVSASGGALPSSTSGDPIAVQEPSATPGDSNPALPSTLQSKQQSVQFPQRSSSQADAPQDAAAQAVPVPEAQPQVLNLEQQTLQHQQSRIQNQSPPGSHGRPSTDKSAHRPSASDASPSMSADPGPDKSSIDIAHHPATPMESGSTKTGSLAFISSLPSDDRKTDKKSKDKEETEGGKLTGWKWFKSDDRERKKKEKDSGRERDREREKEREEHSKKLRTKSDRTQHEKAHDGARLDVLQSYDNPPKGRESVLIDRDSVDGKVNDEKKKELGNRKTSETKKEKDGFFGSIFGGSRRKDSKDAGSSKVKQRIASPEPPPPLLQPDIDYPYTRFPIVEERAIYRMAHLKLANPGRELRSQVLLSNFMYSYLAKVQAMHPQLNVPTSPHQKRQEEERRRREQEQQQQQFIEQQKQEQEQLQQQQQQQQQQHQEQGNVDQYNFEYHRSASPYGDTGQHLGERQDGSAGYEYDHGTTERQHHVRTDASEDDDTTGSSRGYYDYRHTNDSSRGEGEMW